MTITPQWNLLFTLLNDFLETDYLVVGSGLVGMAFADTLFTETDANIIIIDRYAKPGGHWNLAYPFVTLHQPSAYFGVSSKELSRGEIDHIGLNKGMSDLAKIERNKDIDIKKGNIYILCSFGDSENTYIFNTNKRIFSLIDELDVIPYAVNFNDAYIVASNEAIELTINRVSGKAVLVNELRKSGVCKLTNKTKF